MGNSQIREPIQKRSIEKKEKIIECGFSQTNVYGDFDFSPYNENARTMVIVARK